MRSHPNAGAKGDPFCAHADIPRGAWDQALHTVDKVIHLAERGFTGFAKEALRLYAPEGVVFEPRLIDKVVQEKLNIRDLEFFDPPPVL